MFIRCCAFCILTCFASLPSMAQAQLAYGVDIDNLYTVNLSTATSSLIGQTGAPLMEGLALSSSGQLFGTDGNGYLYSLSKTTGTATLIGITGRGNIEGLGFVGSQLLGIDFNNIPTIFSINTATALTTNVVTLNNPIGRVRAMTILDSTHVLVLGDNPVYQDLSNVDLTSGNVTVIGQVPGKNSYAIGFGADGILYSLDREGNEYRINQANASGTLIGNTGGQLWLDIASLPNGASAVPEPGSIALLAGFGISSLFALKLRKRRK